MALFLLIIGLIFLVWIVITTVTALFSESLNPYTKWVTIIVVAAGIALVFVDK